jgi:hypothetical protein
VVESGREELRTAILEPEEITSEPRPPPPEKSVEAASGRERGVDVSNEFGWVLVALLGFELLLRVVRTVRDGRFRTAAAPW